jgi:hypothetical protein
MRERQLLWILCVAAACGDGRGGSARGVCADACPRVCAADRDCDTSHGQLCCDFGGAGGHACVDAASCPRFCGDDGQCDTQSGQACVRPTLESAARICAAPQAAVRTCSSDASCGADETCCAIYAEPICLPASQCPKSCAQSTDCAAAGTICCTTLALTDATLRAPGLCIDPRVVPCPAACAQSSDCRTDRGELCCDGVCRASCPKSCATTSDCTGQICCDGAILDSPLTRRRTPGYSTATLGGGSGARCGAIVSCAESCTSQSCFDACVAAGAPTSQSKFSSLWTCIANACASRCSTDAACRQCIFDVQASAGSCGGRTPCGTCRAQYQLCAADA